MAFASAVADVTKASPRTHLSPGYTLRMDGWKSLFDQTQKEWFRMGYLKASAHILSRLGIKTKNGRGRCVFGQIRMTRLCIHSN